MSENRNSKTLVWGALLMTALALGGCASSIADMPVIGTPSDAPARSKDASNPYLPVEDLPPNRDEAVIAPDQQAKIKAELAAARDRQASVAAKDQATTSTGK
jgi:hypothetical protein